MADAFPLSGNIDPRAFPFLIAHLHRQGATGSLKVDGPSYQKAVYFRGGRVLFGSSNDPKDQLGAILIESGRISPEQLEEVNAKVGPGNPLAKVLSDSGFVSQRELSEAARTKVERIVSDVLSYESGSFEFEDGVLPKGAVDLKLSSERLFLAAVRRIGDRNFVLRHLEGLDAVLGPAADADRVLAEIDVDAGPAPRFFDGSRSVKEVAAEARVDEFEAAKVGCALLILGALERSAGVLDLGDTARAAVTTGSTEPGLLLSDADVPDLDLGLARASASQPPPEPDAPTLVRPPESEPLASPERAPEPATLVEAPDTQPPIFAAAEAEPEPAAPVFGARVAEPATLLLPTSEQAFGAEPAPPVAATPPSKEDLAALDALLNARHVEGPLAPMEKRVEPKWEPHFGQGARGGRRPAPGSARRALLGAAAALVLIGAGAVAWLFLGPGLTRTPSAPPATSAPATTTAVPTTLAIAPPSEAPPSTTPEPLASTPSVAAAPATTLATPPSTLAPGASPRAGASGLAEAREAFRRGEYRAAARGFEANLRAAKGGHTVQILVACSDETLQKAQAAVPAPDLYVVPVAYQGRSCYRLLWGVFDTEAQAQAAVAQVPAYFRENGAKPRAVSSASILP